MVRTQQQASPTQTLRRSCPDILSRGRRNRKEFFFLNQKPHPRFRIEETMNSGLQFIRSQQVMPGSGVVEELTWLHKLTIVLNEQLLTSLLTMIHLDFQPRVHC